MVMLIKALSHKNREFLQVASRGFGVKLPNMGAYYLHLLTQNHQ